MTDQIKIEIRSVVEDDAAELIRLAQACLGSQWTKAFVQWKYFQNPAGHIHGCCAELNGEIVGSYGNAPLKIKIGEKIIAVAQAVDAMVAPAARRQGLFVKIEGRVHAQMTESGVRLSYATPNPISRAGFVKRMGWDYPGEIPRYVFILNPAAIIKASGLKGAKRLAYGLALRAIRLLHARRAIQTDAEIRIREVDTFDVRFDALWAQVAVNFPIAVERDLAYLNWRYVENPLMRYTILAAERGDDLRGYAILSHRDMDKGVMAIAELLVAPGDEPAGLSLLSAVTAHAQQTGAAQVQCWMLPQHSFYTRLLERSGFVYSTRRYLPGIFRYTTSLIVKLSSGSTLSPDPRHLDHWYITMGDQDYY